MADSTIAQLSAGAPAQATDVLPVQRAASTLKLSVSDIQTIALLPATPGTKNLCVDCNRTDTYTPDGTPFRPFKTVMSAINQIIANADNSATVPYRVQIAAGLYDETLDVSNPALVNLVIDGGGAAQIGPLAGTGTALNCQDNNLFAKAVFRGVNLYGNINFNDTTGIAPGMASGIVYFYECRFTAGTTASQTPPSVNPTCVLSKNTNTTVMNFIFVSCYCTEFYQWTIQNMGDVYFFNCNWGDAENGGTTSEVPVTATLTVRNTVAGTTYVTFYPGTYSQFITVTLSSTTGTAQIDVFGGVFGHGSTNSSLNLNATSLFRLFNGATLDYRAININNGGTFKSNGGLIYKFTALTIAAGGTYANDTVILGTQALQLGAAAVSTQPDLLLSRSAAKQMAVGSTLGGADGSVLATMYQVADFGSAPTSAGTAGTAGQIVSHGGLLYFCSVTGAAGAATWNALTMTAV